MRDYLAATRDRVVVFDGSMGATLEQFDLSLEDDYKLPGRAHEALVLNRPDVIGDLHESMVAAGAEVVETDTFQASRIKLEEWGLEDHTYEINLKAAEIARAAIGEQRFVAGSIGPTGHLPASDDPTLGKITFRELVAVFEEQARGLVDGGSDLLIIETAQDILEVKAAVFGARAAFKAAGRAVPIQTSVSLLPNGGKMLLGHRHLRRARDARGAPGRRDRPELLDRPRGHARRDPLPRRVLPDPGAVHPERRHPAPGAERRDHLPRGARHARRHARRVRRALRRVDRRRLLRHHDGAHRGDRGARRRPHARRAPRAPPAARLLDDDRDPARAGPGADARRRARQLAGLAQGEGAAPRRRLRRHRPGRRGPGRGRRARARPVRRADRAPGRGRADAARRQEGLAHPARADPGRLDRARGHRARARADPRPRDRQLDQPRGRPRQARPRRADRQGARRRADRAHDRRGRDGQDARAQGRDRRAHPPAGLRGARDRARAADLRPPHVHAHHGRRGVAAVRRRDDRGHPAWSRRRCPASSPRSASPTSRSASGSRPARS